MFIVSGTNDKFWNLLEFVEYLTKNQHQDIEFKINPEAICLKSLGVFKILDLFDFKSVTIHTKNLLESHPHYKIINRWHNPWIATTPLIDTTLHCWTQENIFLSMYHRPTANRLGMASYLFSHHRDSSIVHFPYETDVDAITLFEFDKLATFGNDNLANVSNLLSHMPLRYFPGTLDGIRKQWQYYYNQADGIETYSKIFVDIVSEAHVAGRTFYPTEKTCRPMWLKKPFIIFASRDHLAYLRQIGFRTFADFWNEDYDGYDGRDRFVKILELIDMLAKKSIKELTTMYLDMQYTLDHNYKLLQTQQYKTEITLIE